MAYLLNLVYFLLIIAAMPWLVYQAVTTGKYRKGLGAKLFGLVPRRTSTNRCVWLHAVSVGEVNLLETLIDEIARCRPDWECVVSTTTVTGMSVARKKYPHLSVFYCPLDFSWAVRAALRRIRPSLLVLAELELWPNLIRAAGSSGSKVAVVNGRLSEQSFRGYRRIRPLVSRLLAGIDLVAVQDGTYADRFRRLGAQDEAVHVTGSMKFDGAQTDRGNPLTVRLRQLAGFDDSDVVFLAGSTQEPEEACCLEAYRELADRWPRLRLVIVPRHPERFEAVAHLLDRSNLPWQRRTRLETEGANRNARVLLVDAVGELVGWWGTAQIAFVGGSMGDRGGQNMIEPAAYGAAVCFGPNTKNFRDIVEKLLACRGAVVVDDRRRLTEFVGHCLEDPDEAADLGSRARAVVSQQLGATRRTFDLLAALIDDPACDGIENPVARGHHDRACCRR